MNKKKLISLYVDKQKYELFKELSKNNGSSMSKEVRKMINEYIKNNTMQDVTEIIKTLQDEVSFELKNWKTFKIAKETKDVQKLIAMKNEIEKTLNEIALEITNR